MSITHPVSKAQHYVHIIAGDMNENQDSLFLSCLCLDYSFPEARSFTHTHGFSSRSMIHTPSRIMAVSTAHQNGITL